MFLDHSYHVGHESLWAQPDSQLHNNLFVSWWICISWASTALAGCWGHSPADGRKIPRALRIHLTIFVLFSHIFFNIYINIFTKRGRNRREFLLLDFYYLKCVKSLLAFPIFADEIGRMWLCDFSLALYWIQLDFGICLCRVHMRVDLIMVDGALS